MAIIWINDLCHCYGRWANSTFIDGKIGSPYSEGTLARAQREGKEINIQANDPFKFVSNPKQTRSYFESLQEHVPTRYAVLQKVVESLDPKLQGLFYLKYLCLFYKGRKVKDKHRCKALGISKRLLYYKIDILHAKINAAFDEVWELEAELI